MEFITDKSPEGTQFVKGFSGLGGFLRYKVDTDHLLNKLIQLYISAREMEKMDRDDQSIEIFRMKRLFKRLETAKVSGSVITVIIPPRKNVSDVTKLLAE